MSACEACGRDTRTVRGICTNCGHLKDTRFAPPPKRLGSGPSLWSDDLGAIFIGFAVLSILGGAAYFALETLL